MRLVVPRVGTNFFNKVSYVLETITVAHAVSTPVKQDQYIEDYGTATKRSITQRLRHKT